MAPLRISLTLSGGASLGAYEAGAAAGVALAVRHLDREQGVEASIDSIGGASAGSIVGLLTCYALLEGLDPVDLLHEAWVERVSLSLLRGTESNAPLSFDDLRDRIPELLDPNDRRHGPGGRERSRQERSIAFHVELTGLQGLTYPIRGLRRDAPVIGATYSDWGRFKLEPGGGIEQITEPSRSSPLDFVLASAASPGGFAPQLLDRSEDADAYAKRGIDNFPESGHLWYSDGGLVGSQPIGRAIAAGERVHGGEEGARRLVLLINPRSEVPEGKSKWADPDDQPSWQDGLSRGLAVLSEQGMFDDLRRIEKVNTRLEWTDALVEALAPHLKVAAPKALRKFAEAVEAERAEMRSDEPFGSSERALPGEDAEPAELLAWALRETAGLARKQPVDVDVISPLLLSEEGGDDVESLLAGEFLGDFGGFLSHELRASDFALGYESAIAWLGEGLARCEIDDAAVRATVETVEDRRPYERDEVQRGDATLSDLSLRDRFQLVRLGLHMGRVLGAGALAERSRIRDSVGNLISSCAGLVCSFSDLSTDADGTIASRAWDFGDGATSAAANPSHTYAAAGSYDVRLIVEDDDGDTTSFTRQLAVGAPPPANDDLAAAEELSGASDAASGSNLHATRQSGEPAHVAIAGGDGGASVWYRWTAPANGTVGLSTCGASFDTLLAAYTGTAIASLASVASNDDSPGPSCAGTRDSELAFEAVAGTTYRIAVDGFDPPDTAANDPDTGTIAIALSLSQPAPAVDPVPATPTIQPTTPTSIDDPPTGEPEADPDPPRKKLRNRKLLEDVAGARGERQIYTITVPRRTRMLRATLGGPRCVAASSGCVPDLDLYLRAGREPTDLLFDCAATQPGPDETCRIGSPPRGMVYAAVHNLAAAEGTRFQIKAVLEKRR